MSDEITCEDMEKAIKEIEAKGYINVKVTHCRFWKGCRKDLV